MMTKKNIPIIIALVFALFAVVFVLSGRSFAAEQTLTFQWEQDSTDVAEASFRGWKLYHVMDQPGGPYALYAEILYDGLQQTVYSSTQTLTVPDNETHTHYFVLTAFNSQGHESDYSNEASTEIAVYLPPSVPFSFSVTITTGE